MNLHSIFEELDQLYEPEELATECDTADKKPGKSSKNKLAEAVNDDEEIIITDDDGEEIIIEDDEPDQSVEDDSTDEIQFVLECTNCGGIVIKSEAEVDTPDANAIVNVDDSCQYCEEAGEYKIIGTLVPYQDSVPEEADAE